MLIDNEKEEFGELEIEEQKISQKAELPEKYRDKSLDDIVKMHQEAEKLIGKQAQEVGEVRKLADELIKQNLGSRQQQTSAGHQDLVESRESITWRHMTEQASTEEWQSLFHQVDFVVHLAARVHVMHEEARTALSAHLKANTEFTKHLATIARDQGVSRFVFVSTIKVLGEKTLQEPFVISSNENPQDPYSRSKILAEIALQKVCASTVDSV